jgi:cytoskeletal protein RodZ
MATIGEQLRTAREAKGITQTEAGTATNILTKIIVAMEEDDFSAMAAPTYAKGFLRLYGKFLEIDPEPLIEEYSETCTEIKPSLNSEAEKIPAKKLAVQPERISDSAMTEFTNLFANFKMSDIRVVAIIVASVVILSTILFGIVNLVKQKSVEEPEKIVQQAAPVTPKAPAPKKTPEPRKAPTAHMLLDEALPNLYLVKPGQIESSR